MVEEKRLFEEQLNQLGVGLIDVQFVPPSPEILIVDGINNPLKIFHYSDLLVEEAARPINNDAVDLAKCNKYLESNRFKGLLPIIVTMDQKMYYRLTALKTRASRSVL